jgi:hypothetical protein
MTETESVALTAPPGCLDRHISDLVEAAQQKQVNAAARNHNDRRQVLSNDNTLQAATHRRQIGTPR